MGAYKGYAGGRYQEMRQFKSWCIPSERKTEDEVEMMVAEVWKRREKRGQVEHHSQNCSSLRKNTPPWGVWYCLCSTIYPKSYEACIVWGISFPKTLSRQFLFCGHYIKREILVHLVSRKLAFQHPEASVFSGQFVLLGRMWMVLQRS